MDEDVKLKNALSALQIIMENDQFEKNWRPTWNDIKDFEAPDRGKYLANLAGNETEYNQGGGGKRQWMLDATPERAGGTLAASFMSFLTPKARPWFRLNVGDKELNRDPEVRAWLDDVAAHINDIMTSRGSNFYPSLHNVYTEVSFFGTAAMMIEEDRQTSIHCRTFTVGEYALQTNARGDVDTFIRQDYWTAKQIVDKFGLDRASKSVQSSYNPSGFTKPFHIYHAIVPNDGLIPIDSGKKFLEVYWQAGEKGVLSTSGYNDFPIMCPRWNTVGSDVYGTECPGMRAIGASQMLQEVYEDWTIAFKKEARPPMVADASIDILNLEPDGVSTSTGAQGNQHALRPAFQVSANLSAATEALRETREEIKETYFNHLFLAFTQLKGDRRNEMEIGARQEEKFGLLGPIMNSLDEDLLSVSIERIVNVESRRGTFNVEGALPMPEQLADAGIDIEYTSMLAQAAKAVGNNNLDIFIERVAAIGETIDPNALKKIDGLELVDHLFETQGIAGRIMRTDQEVEELIQQEQQAQQQQTQLEQSAIMASGAKDLAQAPLGDGNALESTLEAVEGA